MSKLPLVLRELHRSETSIARDLRAMADRHSADREIFHVARDIAEWSEEHIRQLAEIARRQNVRLRARPRLVQSVLSTNFARRASTELARRPEPGLVLLADLRRLHRKAAGVALDWELLGQAAQAMRQRDLLELTQRCRPHTLRQMQWAEAQLKIHSPQVIAS